MGCINSTKNEVQQEAHKEIERQLRVDQEKSMKEIKLLLLGAGECGKSTILKQMSIIHGKGYTGEDKNEFIPIIYANIVQSMAAILKAMDLLEIPLENENLESYKNIVHESMKNAEDGGMSISTIKALTILWADIGVKEAFKRAKEYQLNDSAEYYLTDLERISTDDYIPTVQDILRSRIKTTGIIESYFHFKDLDFKVFDVGMSCSFWYLYLIPLLHRWSTV